MIGTRLEYFDVVDEDDRVIDRKPRSECLDRGLLHRAILVFLLNAVHEVYLQKRADDLHYYPGYWSASVTGHLFSGETYAEGAAREVKEELGLECGLDEVVKFTTPKWRIGERTEWEVIMVFEAIVADPAIRLSDETTEGKFVSLKEFKRLLATEPEKFTPDTLLAAAKYPKTK
jgi:isopentenyldiphosphate isomerase